VSLTKERDGIEVETPEHDKLMAIPSEHRNLIQEFIDWIYENDLTICNADDSGCLWADTAKGDIVGRFFGIDPKKFSKEKDDIVRALQREYLERRKNER
jgi:hypothetical protein